MRSVFTLGLASLALLLGPGAAAVVVVNGDFELDAEDCAGAPDLAWACEDLGWDATGMASVEGGLASIGQFGCLGDEGLGEVGLLRTSAPVLLSDRHRIQFTYHIETNDVEEFDGFILRATAQDGATLDLLRFNPHDSYLTCATYDGAFDLGFPGGAGLYDLEFSVYEDGYGDLFGITLDDVRVTGPTVP
jgi:hypothetical protein